MSLSYTRTDLRWTDSSLFPLTILSAALAVVAAVGQLRRPVRIGADIPVDRARADSAAERINPNAATAASLCRLPGIGPVRAQAILSYRQAHGPRAFPSAEDLAGVKGIGPATVERIAPLLALPLRGAASAPASVQAASSPRRGRTRPPGQ